MLESLTNGERIVGTKQVLKAISSGVLKCVYIAEDVEPFLYSKLYSACETAGTPVVLVNTMSELGKACGIDVGAACAGIVK